MTVLKAPDVRDALAKALRDRLFIWLVDTINKAIAENGESGAMHRFIGVLDIFG